MPFLPARPARHFQLLRATLLAGVAAVGLSACASNRSQMQTPDYSGMSVSEAQQNLGQLSARFQADPGDRDTAIHFAAALRASGQNAQSVAVMEQAMQQHGDDPAVAVSYAKSLAAAGRFDQALNLIDRTIDPASPGWNALSVKGAILDQMGRNREARQYYEQALFIAPNEPSLHVNLGLSHAMTGELQTAETQLRKALSLPGADSRVRQNYALVIGLQGRFEEARSIYARELPADQVEANMAYIRALLTQQNRWDTVQQSS